MTFFQRIRNKLKRSLGLGVRKTEPWFELAEAALIYKAESYKPCDLNLLKLTGVEIGAHRGNHAARILSRLLISSLCLIDPSSHGLIFTNSISRYAILGFMLLN